jgi:hypothetical protein
MGEGGGEGALELLFRVMARVEGWQRLGCVLTGRRHVVQAYYAVTPGVLRCPLRISLSPPEEAMPLDSPAPTFAELEAGEGSQHLQHDAWRGAGYI